MPQVRVSVWEGFSAERARKVIQGITRVFGDVGIPEQALQVVIEQIPKAHWGIGGEPASEKFAEAPKRA